MSTPIFGVSILLPVTHTENRGLYPTSYRSTLHLRSLIAISQCKKNIKGKGNLFIKLLKILLFVYYYEQLVTCCAGFRFLHGLTIDEFLIGYWMALAFSPSQVLTPPSRG
jgi:hypothetical protein